MERIIRDYFDWLCDLVGANELQKPLLDVLFEREFTWDDIPMDENRATDGKDLRRLYIEDCGLDESDEFDEEFFDEPCTVLEMMVGIARRCEIHIMRDDDIGDRLGTWFWDMIDNLKLSKMTGRKFNRDYVNERIDILLNRTYERDGEGGLFKVDDPPRDMRSVEIWYQLQLYLNERY